MAWLALKAIFGLSIVTITAFGAGGSLSLFIPSEYRRFERITFVLLGGFGILSTALFLVGQLSFTRRSIDVTLAVAAILAILLFRRVFPRGVLSPREVPAPAAIS